MQDMNCSYALALYFHQGAGILLTYQQIPFPPWRDSARHNNIFLLLFGPPPIRLLCVGDGQLFGVIAEAGL
jgi:hypothetical protein